MCGFYSASLFLCKWAHISNPVLINHWEIPGEMLALRWMARAYVPLTSFKSGSWTYLFQLMRSKILWAELVTQWICPYHMFFLVTSRRSLPSFRMFFCCLVYSTRLGFPDALWKYEQNPTLLTFSSLAKVNICFIPAIWIWIDEPIPQSWDRASSSYLL